MRATRLGFVGLLALASIATTARADGLAFLGGVVSAVGSGSVELSSYDVYNPGGAFDEFDEDTDDVNVTAENTQAMVAEVAEVMGDGAASVGGTSAGTVSTGSISCNALLMAQATPGTYSYAIVHDDAVFGATVTASWEVQAVDGDPGPYLLFGDLSASRPFLKLGRPGGQISVRVNNQEVASIVLVPRDGGTTYYRDETTNAEVTDDLDTDEGASLHYAVSVFPGDIVTMASNSGASLADVVDESDEQSTAEVVFSADAAVSP